MVFAVLFQLVFAANTSHAQNASEVYPIEIDPAADYSRDFNLLAYRKPLSSTQVVVDPKNMPYLYILPTGYKSAIDEKKGEVGVSVHYQEMKLTEAQAGATIKKFSEQISQDLSSYDQLYKKKLSLKVIDTNLQQTAAGAGDHADNIYVYDRHEKINLPPKISLSIEDGPLDGIVETKDGSKPRMFMFNKGNAMMYSHRGGGQNLMANPYYCTFGFDSKSGQYYLKRDEDILFRTRSLEDIFQSNTMYMAPCLKKEPVTSCEIAIESDETFYHYRYIVNGRTVRSVYLTGKDDIYDWIATHIPEMFRDKKCKFPEELLTTKISRQITNIAKRQSGLSIFCEPSPQEKIENKLKKKR